MTTPNPESSPIFAAVEKGDLEQVKATICFRMIKRFERLVIILSCLLSCAVALSDEIHKVAAQGDTEKLKSLLEANPELIFAKDAIGDTPLHEAVGSRRLEAVTFLLANKADVNANGYRDRTPLQIAVSVNSKEIVALLLANGANVNAKALGGTTPLHSAGLVFDEEIVKLLIANKAEVNARTVDNVTPLHLAASQGRERIVEVLLKNGAEVNAKDASSRTPLIEAVSFSDSVETIRLLLSHGADVGHRDNHGDTALRWAEMWKKHEIADLLRTDEAARKSSLERTALHAVWIVGILGLAVAAAAFWFVMRKRNSKLDAAKE